MTLLRETPKFCLKWNEFECQLKLVFQHLYESKALADVTLQCDHEGSLVEVKAHKVVLSMYSPFLNKIFMESSETHPVVTMDGVSAFDLNSVLEFIYLGKVSVYEDHIQGFVETAKFLKIDGIELQEKRPIETAERMQPLNLSKDSPTYPFEHSTSPAPMTKPLKIEAGNASLLRPMPRIEAYNSEETSKPDRAYHCFGYQAVSSSSNRLSPTYNDYRMYSYASTHSTHCLAPKFCPMRVLAPSTFAGYQASQIADQSSKQPTAEDKESNNSSQSSSPTISTLSDSNVELFTTPSGVIVSTAYGHKPSVQTTPTSGGNVSPLTLMSNMMKMSNVNPAVPDSTESTNCTKKTSQKMSTASKHNPQKSIKYTPSQVRAIVQSVEGVKGPFVPCNICQKVVKRERLRTHIYECHLVNGEKIHCPFCNVALKSKGSYRVHVWRHRNGNLKKSGKMRGLNPKVTKC